MKDFKKIMFIFLVGILSFMGLNTKVEAATTAPSTIRTWAIYELPKYVHNLPVVHQKPLQNGVWVYCENEGLRYWSDYTMYLNGKVNDGFIYILENKPNTGDSKKDYYIMQIAVWWYEDIVSGNNKNLTTSQKQYITNNASSNDICKKIYNLVNGAKNYKQQKGYIKFDTNNVTFKEENGNYISSLIKINYRANKMNDVTITGAPKGTTIINKTDKNGVISFQIKVPVSSVNPGQTVKIKINSTGTYKIKKVYDYYLNAQWQKVIYGEIFADTYNISDSKELTLTRPEIHHNKLIINKVDESGKFVSGAELTLYKGNCVNSTCNDAYASWTTTDAAKSFTDIPVGKYTLVETKAPNGYRVADKMLINVHSDNASFTYKMVDKAELKVRISKTDITGEKEIPGATLIVKDSKGNAIETWVSTNEPKYIVLEPGEYSLTETIAPKGYILSKTSVYFKLDENGSVYEKDANGEYVKVDYVKMINLVKEAINITKLDSNTNEYVSGAVLVIKDLEGKTIDRWTTTNESHYVSLEQGEYILIEESAPNGYVLNKEGIHIKVDAENNLYIKNAAGEFVKANGVIMYNTPEEKIVVPKTGLTSTLTYVIGTITLAAGAIVLFKNEKKC